MRRVSILVFVGVYSCSGSLFLLRLRSCLFFLLTSPTTIVGAPSCLETELMKCVTRTECDHSQEPIKADCR
jgi:hypothetical protein